METESRSVELRNKDSELQGGQMSTVQSVSPNSKNVESKKQMADVPSIRLSPEQIEEIHADEYSLTLFYATRMQALSLNEVKRHFPEPEPKKAQSVMERYLKAGLIHKTDDDKYYSNYPENYINYSHYRYDCDLEAKKDAKVFQIMKEQTGKLDFWKDKSYFSMDAFYSDEQTRELQKLFTEIKVKAKNYANENAKKKSIKGLTFRRLKFFDMAFSFLICLILGLGFSSPSNALAGGNDPIGVAALGWDVVAFEVARAGGGNDPTGVMSIAASSIASDDDCRGCSTGGGGHDPNETDPDFGGGGHDPGDERNDTNESCTFEFDGQIVTVHNARVCKIRRLLAVLQDCENIGEEACDSIVREVDVLLMEYEAKEK